MLLEVSALEVRYGGIRAVKGVDFAVGEGELVCLIGANGAGKTTTLKAICGMLPVHAGCVRYGGSDLASVPVFERPRRGLVLVPEGRGIFPRLRERKDQLAGTMSGGEQQMLAMGRALMSQPKVLLLDEPSMGLAPLLVSRIFEIVREISRQGVTILLVEQNAKRALEIADRGYVMESGAITLADDAKALLANPKVREAYLGEGAEA